MAITPTPMATTRTSTARWVTGGVVEGMAGHRRVHLHHLVDRPSPQAWVCRPVLADRLADLLAPNLPGQLVDLPAPSDRPADLEGGLAGHPG
jgi:hypothetical protein